MLALCGLALAAMLLPLPAARASHWDIGVTDKGGSNRTFKGDCIEWFPPSTPGNNTITFDAYAADVIDSPNDDTDTESPVTVNATVTLTWVAAPAGDPAPPYVWVVENASASAFAAGTGAVATANDGLTPDPYVNTPTNPDQDSATMSTPSGLPGGGRLKKLTVSGGSATFDRTLTAKGTSTFSSTDPFPGTQNATVSDTVSIHATPYNFRRKNFDGESTSVHVDNGLLTFHYVWSSTSGSLGDLSGETIHENVACSVQTDNPPFLWQPPPLTDISVAADASKGLDDINSYGTYPGELVQDAFAKPYKVDHFTLTQSFLFNDPVIMTTSDRQPIPLTVGPYTILNAVVADPSSPSGFSFVVTKDSVPSDPINLKE